MTIRAISYTTLTKFSLDKSLKRRFISIINANVVRHKAII